MTTKTTAHLSLPRPRWFELSPPVAAALVIFCLLSIAGLVGRIQSDTRAAAVPTPALPAPIIIIASPLPMQPPTAAPPAAQVAAIVPNTLRRAVVAYDAPEGNVIGAIDQGRAYTVLARFGADWLQADVSGSGVVWLRADQVLDLPAGLVDLQPPPAPAVVYVPVSVPAYAAPTPEPYQTASEGRLANEGIPTPVWAPVPAVVRAEDFVQPEDRAHCVIIGCMGP